MDETGGFVVAWTSNSQDGSYNTIVGQRFDAPPKAVLLDLERTIPCGMLVNELVTNAYKHAFVGGRGLGFFRHGFIEKVAKACLGAGLCLLRVLFDALFFLGPVECRGGLLVIPPRGDRYPLARPLCFVESVLSGAN